MPVFDDGARRSALSDWLKNRSRLVFCRTSVFHGSSPKTARGGRFDAAALADITVVMPAAYIVIEAVFCHAMLLT